MRVLLYLSDSPPSPHSYCSPSGSPDTNCCRCAFCRHVQISASVYAENGSRFRRNVPENITGSCSAERWKECRKEERKEERKEGRNEGRNEGRKQEMREGRKEEMKKIKEGRKDT